MKAAVFRRCNQMAVVDVPQPRAGAGEVVLKVHDCGICGSDLHAVQTGLGLVPDCVMGHEFCGEIHELGAGVRGVRIGERVTSLPYISCGKCAHCVSGNGIRCAEVRGIGLGQLSGAYAEYVLCGAGSLLRLPDNVRSREGALAEPLAVALHGVNRSGIGPGAACVVMGAGPIGLATVLWCKAKGAAKVIVSELTPGRLALAEKVGADAVVDPRQQHPSITVQEIAGREPDIVFECVGAKSALEQAIGIVAPQGRVEVLGVCMEPDQITPVLCVLKEISIDFSFSCSRADFEETVAALSEGRIDAGPMITSVIDVDEVPAAFEMLRTPSAQGKVMVEFPH